MNDAATLTVGDRVLYRGCWGRFPEEEGVITGKGSKNSRAVYNVRLDNGKKHWGYADQFEKAESCSATG